MIVNGVESGFVVIFIKVFDMFVEDKGEFDFVVKVNIFGVDDWIFFGG